MKKIKFITAAVLLSTSLSALAGELPSLEGNQALVGKITAQVTIGGQENSTTATGVLLDPQKGLFLTNLHNIVYCLKDLGADPYWSPDRSFVGQTCRPEVLWIQFRIAGQLTTLKGGKLIDYGSLDLTGPGGPYRDWALLQIDSMPLSQLTPPKIAKNASAAGRIYAFGFPIRPVGEVVDREWELYKTSGEIRSMEETRNLWDQIYSNVGLSPDQLQHLSDIARKNFFMDASATIFHNAPSFSGYSGGPAFNEHNELLGLFFGSIAVWNFQWGDFPEDKLGQDPHKPNKPANALSAIVSVPRWGPSEVRVRRPSIPRFAEFRRR